MPTAATPVTYSVRLTAKLALGPRALGSGPSALRAPVQADHNRFMKEVLVFAAVLAGLGVAYPAFRHHPQTPGRGYRLWFRRHGELHTSPEEYATRPDAERALWLMASKGQADSQHDRRYRALVLLATFASLRWGEAAALRRCDLDVGAGTVPVRADFIERSTGLLILGRRSPRLAAALWASPSRSRQYCATTCRCTSPRTWTRCYLPGSRAARCDAATSISSPAGRMPRGPSAPRAFTSRPAPHREPPGSSRRAGGRQLDQRECR